MAFAAGSGVLYGSINVLAKLVPAHPFVKGAVAYLASFLLLAVFLRGLHIEKRDWPKVLVMGIIGGGVAPALLFVGLQETSAADTGLLLTFEMVATGALAVMFLGERFGGRDGAGLVCLLAASLAVAFATTGDASVTTTRGAILVLGAALAWGIDNVVSARLVGLYKPHQLIALKGILGGSLSLTAAVALEVPVPSVRDIVALVAIGVISICLSSLLFYTALQRVGASRTSAMNVATTALIGAIGGSLLLAEQLGPIHVVEVGLVLAGAVLLGRRPKEHAASVPV